MTVSSQHEMGRVTQLLQKASEGDVDARERCYAVVHDKLRQIASANMSAEDMLSLNATMVINDTWLNLIVVQDIGWESRRQFLCYAARTVRNILCDYARKRTAAKRNPGYRPQSLTDDDLTVCRTADALTQLERDEEALALNAAMQRLDANHPEYAAIVELRYYGGFTFAQIATDILNVDVSTVRRRWNRGRTLLKQYLTENELPPGNDKVDP